MKAYTYNMNGETVSTESLTMLSEEDIQNLKREIRSYYTDKRYLHALAVEDEAKRLGEIFLPERINALRAAALLHDITKKYDFEKQLKCCEDFGIIINNPFSPEILHALTGAVVAEKEFSRYTDREILDGIRYHTTGRWGMTVFDAIIFLADYIEPNRTHENCVSLRNELYARLSSAETESEQEKALNAAVVKALDNTVSYLLYKKAVIDINTISARNFYLSEKEL